MAGATLSSTSVQALLHDFYRGPIQETLNNETLMVELLEKGSFTWAGKQVVIPLHLGRNTGVGYRGLASSTSGNLPTAGAQVLQNVISNATYLYGRFEVDGPSLASAKKGGKHAFAGALDLEMNKLTEDLRDHANLMFFVGSEVKGLINEKVAWPVKSAAATTVFNAAGNGAANSSDRVCEYDGDYTIFDGTWVDPITGVAPAAVDPANTGTWVRVDLVRLDTYRKTVGDGTNGWGVTYVGGGGTMGALFVSNFSKSSRTITISACNDAGVNTSPFTSAAVELGKGIAVAINQTRWTKGGDFFGVRRYVGDEPHGLLQNLCDDVLFNLERGNTAANAEPANGGKELRATVLTVNIANLNQRIALDTDMLQTLIDEVDEASGKEFSLWLMNTRTRQSYVGASQMFVDAAGVAAKVVKTTPADSAGGLDAGFSVAKMSYGGIPFRTSRHCPRGMFIGFKQDVWKMAELSEGDFADLDGAVLSRISGQDSWEGFWRWYHQVVCCSPKCNGILHGFTL